MNNIQKQNTLSNYSSQKNSISINSDYLHNDEKSSVENNINCQNNIPNSQSSQKKFVDAGDLNISISNPQTNNCLFSMAYFSKTLTPLQLSNNQNTPTISKTSKKEFKGAVQINIFEDKFGKRSYEFGFDFPEDAKLQKKIERERASYLMKGDFSDCIININNKETNTQNEGGNLIDGSLCSKNKNKGIHWKIISN